MRHFGVQNELPYSRFVVSFEVISQRIDFFIVDVEVDTIKGVEIEGDVAGGLAVASEFVVF